MFLLLFAIPAVAVAALFWLYRRPLPQLEGRVVLPGLKAPVEVIRDRWGVPHLYASHVDDVLFAQGFVHAQDRLWQMDLNRRVGHGRLSEAFGSLAFDTDRLLRILGFSRSAHETLAATDGETLAALECYARGVNAFIAANPGRCGLEFTLLGIKPEPWKPVDSLVWTKMMAWGLSTNWDTELINAALVAKLGPERAAKLHAEYPAGNPIVIPEQTLGPLAERVLEQLRSASSLPGLSGLFGLSNNWVVDGHKSTTGKPLLANDPHLALQMPSIWYENHLVSPESEVTGVSLPGVPGVVIGHNREVAWGFTAALPDTQDLFVEKRNPANPLEFEFDGKWEAARVVREEVRVKGERAPRIVEVIITRHGPLIDQLPPLADRKQAPPEYAVSLRWSGHDVGQTHRAALKMDRAKTSEEFIAALADWSGPSMNVLWADRAGNIGYHLTGQIPIRKSGVGAAPVPGWNDDFGWSRYIPHDELPQCQNPAQHFLASANNRIVGDEYPHFLGAETMNGFRARRIVELLQKKDKLDADDFARMHIDQYCAPAKPFCDLLLSLKLELGIQPALLGLHSGNAFRELEKWNHHLSADSVAGSIYQVTQHFALRRLFRPHLGDLTEPFLGVGFHPVIAPITLGFMDRSFLIGQRILIENDKEWLGEQTREQLLAESLADALRWLGSQGSDWSWGHIHSAGFHHPLGAKKPLDKLFNRGPFPYGGDTNTVWQAAFVPRLPISPAGGFTASWRMIVDLADWDASRAVHTTGQSGHPASPHYDDMIWMWLRGQYHPMLWAREKVDAHAAHRLTLSP